MKRKGPPITFLIEFVCSEMPEKLMFKLDSTLRRKLYATIDV